MKITGYRDFKRSEQKYIDDLDADGLAIYRDGRPFYIIRKPTAQDNLMNFGKPVEPKVKDSLLTMLLKLTGAHV